MHVIVGLGNPGKKYDNTRHNIGFKIVDRYAENLKSPFKPGKGDFYYSEFIDNDSRILLIKPTTYMNNSGLASKFILNYFPVEIKNFLIVYDDFHLPFGTLRFRKKGSDGGHNGLRSVINHFGTEEISRLRFGVGNEFDDSVSHVLSAFRKDEIKYLNGLIDTAVDGINSWIAHGIDKTMDNFNKLFI